MKKKSPAASSHTKNKQRQNSCLRTVRTPVWEQSELLSENSQNSCLRTVRTPVWEQSELLSENSQNSCLRTVRTPVWEQSELLSENSQNSCLRTVSNKHYSVEWRNVSRFNWRRLQLGSGVIKLQNDCSACIEAPYLNLWNFSAWNSITQLNPFDEKKDEE